MNDLQKELAFLNWSESDSRWASLEHFLARVSEAGLALVSNRDRDRLLDRHLIPSLDCLEFILENSKIMDVGSGGGFPALPIAIARPDVKVVMIESNERKSAFLRRVSRETGVANAVVYCQRVENQGDLIIDNYDIVTARAFSEMTNIVETTRRFLRQDGVWLLWKGKDWRSEANLGSLGVKLIKENGLRDGSRLIVLKREKNENNH
jgi:16S rRNA (guanine527-N7)-methyltransferase